MVLDLLIESQWTRAGIFLGMGISIILFLRFIIRKIISPIIDGENSDIDEMLTTDLHKPLCVLIFIFFLSLSYNTLTLSERLTNSLDSLSYVVIALTTAYFLSHLLTTILKYHFKKRKHDSFPKVFGAVTSVAFFAIAFVMILNYFEVEIAPLVATLGLGGLAIGLALKDTLQNLFSGLHLIATRSFKVGDYIKINGVDIGGYVVDIGWRETLIRTFQNQLVIFPNAKLSESIIINTQLPSAESSVVIECGVAYDSDLEYVEKIVIEEAKKIQKSEKGAIKDYVPLVRYNEFADSNINFNIILRAKNFTEQYIIKHEFIKCLKKRFDREGIEISFPSRKIYDVSSPQLQRQVSVNQKVQSKKRQPKKSAKKKVKKKSSKKK